jgi:hypothetical protein
MKGDLMKCPYLVRCAVSKCKAANKYHMPSLFELKEYCGLGNNFKKCPCFRSLAGKKKNTSPQFQMS